MILQATDPDLAENGTAGIVYTALGADPFRVTREGQVLLAQPWDRVEVPDTMYNFDVDVTDRNGFGNTARTKIVVSWTMKILTLNWVA